MRYLPVFTVPALANALAARLFGTRQLAIKSSLWLAGIGLLLGTLPGVVLFVGSLTVVGLLAFILPGRFIAVVGLGVGGCLVVLFVRGYLHLAIRCFNWLSSTYFLAQQDVTHHVRSASTASPVAPAELELAPLAAGR